MKTLYALIALIAANLTLCLAEAAVEPIMLKLERSSPTGGQPSPGSVTNYVVPLGKVLVIEHVVGFGNPGGSTALVKQGQAIVAFPAPDQLTSLSPSLKLGPGMELVVSTNIITSYSVFGLLVDAGDLYLAGQNRLSQPAIQNGEVSVALTSARPRPPDVVIEKSADLGTAWVKATNAVFQTTANPYRQVARIPVEEPRIFLRTRQGGAN
jgi:hypothetical protein